MKKFIAVFMSIILSNVIALAAEPSDAGESGGTMIAMSMIPTTQVVDEMTVSEARGEVQKLLDRKDVRAALEKRGLSDKEMSARLATLSPEEVQKLHKQIEQARYGGDVLVTVLLVLLIIFLIQRI